MSEPKGKYRNWGGKRTAGDGKKIGKPADIGGNGKRYQNYLDDETINILEEMINAKIAENRSEAIRKAVKSYKIYR